MTIRTSAQAALAIINAANGTSFSLEDVYFDQVLATTSAEAAANDGANTKALVVPLKKKTPTMTGDSSWVYYNRLDLASVMPANATAVPTVAAWHVCEAMPEHPAAFGLRSIASDVNDIQLGTTTADFTIAYTAVPNNPAYIGTTTLKYNHAKAGAWAGPEGVRSVWGPGRVGYAYSANNRPSAYYMGPVMPTAVTNSGPLPPGLSISSNLSIGYLSLLGTPTTAGTYTARPSATVSGSAVVGTDAQGFRGVIICAAATTGWDGNVTTGSTLSTDKYSVSAANTVNKVFTAMGTYNLLGKKTYFEVDLGYCAGEPTMELGFADSTVSVDGTAYPSASTLAWMLLQKTAEFRNAGAKLPGLRFSSLLQGNGALWTHGTNVGFAIDATVKTAVKVWVRYEGNWMPDSDAVASNPATASNPILTFDATAAATLVPCVASMSINNGRPQASLRLSSVSTHFTAPTGFTTPFTN